MKALIQFIILLLIISCKTVVPKKEINLDKGNLRVEIKGLRNDKGNIMFFLFSEGARTSYPQNFKRASVSYRLPANVEENIQIEIPDLAFGKYVIFLIHDESSNNDLDLTIPDKEYLYLIPKWPTEGFGFSSYNRPVLITPKFKDAMFEFNEPEQKVDLNVFYLYARYGFLFVAIPLIISSM